MTEHPESYTMTRAEWLEINRAFASASLAIPRTAATAERLSRVREAQATMGTIYDRAKAAALASVRV